MFNIRQDNLTVLSMLTTTGVVDTGGKLTTGVVTPAIHLLDAGRKFADGVIDTGDAP